MWGKRGKQVKLRGKICEEQRQGGGTENAGWNQAFWAGRMELQSAGCKTVL